MTTGRLEGKGGTNEAFWRREKGTVPADSYVRVKAWGHL